MNGDDCGDEYAFEAVGRKGTKDYAIYLVRNSRRASYWHDVPLKRSKDTYNYVCEIPRGTRAKMEVSTDGGDVLTPIRQDTTKKNNKLRFYHEAIPWNYGMLPRTWESPTHAWPGLKDLPGDDDPVDVIELSREPAECGRVYEVRVLGALALIDEGEVDWKIVAVREDARPRLSAREIAAHVDHVRTWFRDYKIPDGKPPGRFAFDGRFRSASYAKRIIGAAHSLYADRG